MGEKSELNKIAMEVTLVNKTKIGLVPAQNTVDRFRYEPLLCGLNKLGYDAEYVNHSVYNYEVIIISLYNLNLSNLFKKKPRVVIGDVTEDILTRPFNRYNYAGKIFNFMQIVRHYYYYMQLVKTCDHIVVGSEGQARSFAKYNKHISVITDPVLNNDCLISAQYLNKKQLHLVWFGNVASLHGLAAIQDVLDELSKRGQFVLHIITAPTTHQGRLFGKWPANVGEFIKRQKIDCKFHPWTPNSYSRIIASCDIALIPVDAKSSFNLNKPPGRVLLAMSLGLPVVASAIPSHQSVLKHNENGYLALKTDEWLKIIGDLAESIDKRKVIGMNAKHHARCNYNEKEFVNEYHELICSCLSG